MKLQKNIPKGLLLLGLLLWVLFGATTSGSKENTALEDVFTTVQLDTGTIEDAKTMFCHNIEDVLDINKDYPTFYGVQFDNNNDLLVSVDSEEWDDDFSKRQKSRFEETLSNKLAEEQENLGSEYVSGHGKIIDPTDGELESF